MIYKDLIIITVMLIIISIAFILIPHPKQVQALEPEFKIFSVCLEGKKFAVAMKPNAISISAIFSWSHGGQMRCK
jgi:hypothetical protein